MNVDTVRMQEYADFLEDHSHQIIQLCDNLEQALSMAVQCLDQESGRSAAQRMTQNLENIKSSVPISDDACKRLILSKKYVDGAGRVFGG